MITARTESRRRPAGTEPRLRLLMTVDAVGGVWRYSIDLARQLQAFGVATVLAGLGPRPGPDQAAEADAITDLVWLDEPLEWMAIDEQGFGRLPTALARLVRERDIDLLHLNAPAQAAGLGRDQPIVVVSHSCLATWWAAMRTGPLPSEWRWQQRRNAVGFGRADVVVAPSWSHARLLERCYGPVPGLTVVPNAGAEPAPARVRKAATVFAAARWWDEAKGGAVLDAAARQADWPVLAAGSLRGPDGTAFTFRHVAAEGPLGHGDVLARMAEAAVFVSPSTYEPFGLAALEAARAGCALALADIPTYREFWSDCAIFFEPRDPSSLASVLNRLAARAELRDGLAARARERAALFAPERQARAMAELYRGLVRRGDRVAEA